MKGNTQINLREIFINFDLEVIFMHKMIAIGLSTALFAGVLTGCGNSNNRQTETDTISIVTTIFPEYDWARAIVGDEMEHVALTLLLDNGVDLHSYQPSAEDIIQIANCDLFLYVGGESDAWVEDALAQATNSDMIVVNLLAVLGDAVKEEEVVEGMEAEEKSSEEAEEAEYDEHVWLSLQNAQVICQYIADQLCEIDRENCDTYKSNVADYLAKLSDLDEQYQETVSNAARTTILFADRFPFRYMADDYALTYYAAFVGCSAETEASFETIAFLAEKIDELGLTSILTLENSDQKIAETILSTAERDDVQILTMDSMQSITSNDIANGSSYLAIMDDNLEVLAQALN